MLEIKEAYQRLITAKEFKKKGFLCGAFLMAPFKEVDNSDWQIDFYDEKLDRMTSYLVSKEIKLVNEEGEVFKDENTKINEINLEELEFSFEEAYKKAKKELKDKHETANKIIIVLQKSDVLFWNISFVTETFNLINLRISAKNGKILDEKTASLLSFEK